MITDKRMIPTFHSSFEDEKRIAFSNYLQILIHYQCEEFFCEISLVSQGKLFFFKCCFMIRIRVEIAVFIFSEWKPYIWPTFSIKSSFCIRNRDC